MKRYLIFFLGTLLLCAPSTAQVSEDERFQALMEREWSSLNQRQPILAIYLGQQTDRLWPDNTEAARGETDLHYRKVLAELDSFDSSELSGPNRTNLRLFRQQLEWQTENHRHRLDLFSMNQREGLHTTATLTSSIPFDSIDDFETWVARLESFGDYTNREISVLKEAIENRRVQPEVIVQRMIEAVEVQPDLHRDPEKSPFFKPFLEASPQLKVEPRFDSLQQRARSAITGEVRPAFERLTEFLTGPYLSAAPERIGLGQLPGGQEAYAFLVERYTTTELSADEIHQIGLSEVARIRRWRRSSSRLVSRVLWKIFSSIFEPPLSIT